MQKIIYWINFSNYDCNFKHMSNSNKPFFKPKEAYDIDDQLCLVILLTAFVSSFHFFICMGFILMRHLCYHWLFSSGW